MLEFFEVGFRRVPKLRLSIRQRTRCFFQKQSCSKSPKTRTYQSHELHQENSAEHQGQATIRCWGERECLPTVPFQQQHLVWVSNPVWWFFGLLSLWRPATVYAQFKTVSILHKGCFWCLLYGCRFHIGHHRSLFPWFSVAWSTGGSIEPGGQFPGGAIPPWTFDCNGLNDFFSDHSSTIMAPRPPSGSVTAICSNFAAQTEILDPTFIVLLQPFLFDAFLASLHLKFGVRFMLKMPSKMRILNLECVLFKDSTVGTHAKEMQSIFFPEFIFAQMWLPIHQITTVLLPWKSLQLRISKFSPDSGAPLRIPSCFSCLIYWLQKVIVFRPDDSIHCWNEITKAKMTDTTETCAEQPQNNRVHMTLRKGFCCAHTHAQTHTHKHTHTYTCTGNKQCRHEQDCKNLHVSHLVGKMEKYHTKTLIFVSEWVFTAPAEIQTR